MLKNWGPEKSLYTHVGRPNFVANTPLLFHLTIQDSLHISPIKNTCQKSECPKIQRKNLPTFVIEE